VEFVAGDFHRIAWSPSSRVPGPSAFPGETEIIEISTLRLKGSNNQTISLRQIPTKQLFQAYSSACYQIQHPSANSDSLLLPRPQIPDNGRRGRLSVWLLSSLFASAKQENCFRQLSIVLIGKSDEFGRPERWTKPAKQLGRPERCPKIIWTAGGLLCKNDVS
jgi:hypothetical protein